MGSGFTTISSLPMISSTIRPSFSSPSLTMTISASVPSVAASWGRRRTAASSSTGMICSLRRMAHLLTISMISVRRIESISTMEVAGRAQTLPPAETRNSGKTARFSGRRSRKVVPVPSLLSMMMVPLSSSTMLFLTTSMPTPRPDRSVMIGLVLKPGIKIRLVISPLDMPARTSASNNLLARAFSRILSTDNPLPSSLSEMVTQPLS